MNTIKKFEVGDVWRNYFRDYTVYVIHKNKHTFDVLVIRPNNSWTTVLFPGDVIHYTKIA